MSGVWTIFRGTNQFHARGGFKGRHLLNGLSFPKSAERCFVKACAQGWYGSGSLLPAPMYNAPLG